MRQKGGGVVQNHFQVFSLVISNSSYDRNGRRRHWVRGKIINLIHDKLFWQDDLRCLRSMYKDPLMLRLDK